MVTHLRLMTHPVVICPGSLFPKVSWGGPQFFSVVIGCTMTLTQSVINTPTINAYYITLWDWCDVVLHISVACDLVLQLLQKTSSRQSFLRWLRPLQAVQFNCGLRGSVWLLVLCLGWLFVPKFLMGPPLDIFNRVAARSWVTSKELTLFTLPLLSVGSDLFKISSSSGFGVDVGLGALLFGNTQLTGGIGLQLFSSNPIPSYSSIFSVLGSVKHRCGAFCCSTVSSSSRLHWLICISWPLNHLNQRG